MREAIHDLLNWLIKILPYEICKSARPLKSTILEKIVEYVTMLQEYNPLMEPRLNQKANVKCLIFVINISELYPMPAEKIVQEFNELR